MKKIKALSLSLIILLSFVQPSFAAQGSVGSSTRTIKVNNVNKTVNVVTVDLNSPDIELGVTVANDKVSGSEDFGNMIKRKNSVAAINGNFFDAYKTLEPMGTIMINKEMVYLEGTNTSMVISDKRKVDMDNFKIIIKGYLDGLKENKWNNATNAMDFNVFDIWYKNNLPNDSSGVYLYTSARGDKVLLKEGTSIEVIENKITRVVKNPGEQIIPKNGCLIYYGKDAAPDSYINQRFKVGRAVSLENQAVMSSEAKEVESQVKENIISKAEGIISAGPYLVEGGKVIVDSTKEGFKEAKITTDRAQRSAIGITKDNKLIMVTGSNLNVSELAKVMVELGAVKAMNLDGGASSGLYAKGKMITKPGRKLNTVLMVYDKSKKQ